MLYPFRNSKSPKSGLQERPWSAHTTPLCKSKKEMIPMNLQNRKRLTVLKNELMLAGGKDVGEG